MLKSASVDALIQYIGLATVLALLIAFFGFQSDNFFTPASLATIANQIPDLTFLAIGMTFVLVTRGIDLSVGSVLALCSATVGVLMVRCQSGVSAACMAALSVGVLCGLISGALSVRLAIPSFIVTLGMLEICRGLTKRLTDSQTVYVGSAIEGFSEPIAGIGVSISFVIAVAAVAAGQFVLSMTVFGRYCIAIGTNAEAVRMSGIRAWPYAIGVFAISGLMCGLAGVSQTARLSSSDPNSAIGMELSAIAACVVGGTSLMGGRGSVVRSFFGVLIIAVLQTGLAQIGVQDENKQIITGLVIIAAVTLDAVRTRWQASRGG